MIGFQSWGAILQLCPSGTFENSPAIYGWVRRTLKGQSPEGTAEILSCLPFPNPQRTCSLHSLPKKHFLPNKPISKKSETVANQSSTQERRVILAQKTNPFPLGPLPATEKVEIAKRTQFSAQVPINQKETTGNNKNCV
jgi:hypothetical protein